MDHFPRTPPNLTKNQALVMRTLSKAAGPLSAYTILDKLRDDGFRAPPQVYRALDKLLDYGMVHRLESMNAFVACRHPEGETQAMVAFTICGSCGEVTEISDDSSEGGAVPSLPLSSIRLRHLALMVYGDNAPNCCRYLQKISR